MQACRSKLIDGKVGVSEKGTYAAIRNRMPGTPCDHTLMRS